ncbi:hypothetical protein [Sphaerimonospora thailandensis]|uniref:hypothetical protein n=1 Tax=Sphaerimonospora thailandensis TaxID=795644 RepID=UPI0027E4C91B|nr:hypothetical protein [Sphaerimonospora thailandensis]
MLAQRLRDFALLRCIGTTRRQVVRSVRREAAAIGVALAALLLVTGPALLGVAMVRGGTALMLAGGGSVFAGVLLFGLVLVPRLVRIIGPAGRLATKNAVRNPRRTATTTASLLVGVTLTTAVLTGMATWRSSLESRSAGTTPLMSRSPIGVGFAWVGYETVVKRALSDAAMHVPWLSLGVVVLIAALAGLLAAVLPARRAARVTPAAGLSLD